MKRQKTNYMLACAFDTETTNLGTDSDAQAFCNTYMFNDIRGVDLKNYELDKDDNITFIREQSKAISYIVDMIESGKSDGYCPIFCAYNLMFDLQTLIYTLSQNYEMKANAQSGTNAYTVDVYEDGICVLRFWDTYHLEMRGLKAMGETCGIPKATGDWDYKLIRTPETELTDLEHFYASRDVQVIPAYFKYLLSANEWMNQTDLGVRVLTKTSIVRQMARNNIATLRVKKRNGKTMSLGMMFEKMCLAQFPETFAQYGLRKACFRGGFTFTGAASASKVVTNVASLDVTSMHHTFINGRFVPMDFKKTNPIILAEIIDKISNTTLEYILQNYWQPFDFAFHARIRFKNIRMRKNTAFDKWGIALIPRGKFKSIPSKGVDIGENEAAYYAEINSRLSGWVDTAKNPTFAFGKLYEATECVLHLNEIEMWNIAQIYEWDSIEPILGEATMKFKRPPDFVALQSNILFETKQDAKKINKNYKKGEPYALPIPATIPSGIAANLKNGSLDDRFFESYYNSTVKGMFNGIYGTMAQDVLKPSYIVSEGNIVVDVSTTVNKENYAEKKPKKCKVFYNYGMRIVAGSRMHLVIAMILLYKNLGDKVTVTGGDTDSMKVACDKSVTDEMLRNAVEPIHVASTKAIDVTMARIRRLFPEMASQLTDIGGFDIENCGTSKRWEKHMDVWNKARISVNDNHSHITCAGLSRPLNAYHIETFVDELLKKGYDFETIAPLVLGYNVWIDNKICHSLMTNRPNPSDKIVKTVTDYKGNSVKINNFAAVALYPAGRWIGESEKFSNFENIKYLKKHGRKVNTNERSIELENNHAIIRENINGMWETVAEG